MLDSLAVHPDLDAPVEPTASALVPVRLVHEAASGLPGLAGVLPAPPDGPLEEAGTPVAGKNAVVLPGRVIAAHLARHVVQDTARWGHCVGNHV